MCVFSAVVWCVCDVYLMCVFVGERWGVYGSDVQCRDLHCVFIQQELRVKHIYINIEMIQRALHDI